MMPNVQPVTDGYSSVIDNDEELDFRSLFTKTASSKYSLSKTDKILYLMLSCV